MNITNLFKDIPIDYSWSFTGLTIKDTAYLTHGFYTYPAKFIPQIVSRLIDSHSKVGDYVLDPFMGSGTTILEAIVNNRNAIGVDINEIACLVAKVKTTPINKSLLLKEYMTIEMDIHQRIKNNYIEHISVALQNVPHNSRIDFWFKPVQKEKLSIIWTRINEIKNQDLKDFFLVGFAQILKSCSIWMQKSVKPTRDMSKNDIDPITIFQSQIKKMIKKNSELMDILSSDVKNNINKHRTIECGNAYKIPCDDEQIGLVITSPPYVTSYEYADLHQLPSLWFGYMSEISQFRDKFIGSAYRANGKVELHSKIAEDLTNELNINSKKSKEVQSYFADMYDTFLEMKRVLRYKGKICIVIGNTQFKNVDILNAEVFVQQLENIGFKVFDIVHREIPSKMLPSTRDIHTGQFVKADNTNKKLAYPTEYILIMEKI